MKHPTLIYQWGYIWPVLHPWIGVGNAILDHLIDIVKKKIHALPDKEIRLNCEMRDLERDIKELIETWDYRLKTDMGTGSDLIKTLRKKRNADSREMEEMEDADTNMDDEYTSLSMDIKTWVEEFVSLQDELVGIKNNIAKMKTQKKGKI